MIKRGLRGRRDHQGLRRLRPGDRPVGPSRRRCIGGALTDGDLLGLGWRSIFLVNVPLGIAGAGRRGASDAANRRQPGTRLDQGGAVLAMLASFAIVYPLVQGRELDWPAWIFVLFAAGAGGFGLVRALRAPSRGPRPGRAEPAAKPRVHQRAVRRALLLRVDDRLQPGPVAVLPARRGVVAAGHRPRAVRRRRGAHRRGVVSAGAALRAHLDAGVAPRSTASACWCWR